MTATTAPRAGRAAWIGLAVLVLPTLLISMDIMVLYYAIPFISEELSPSSTQQLWIMDIYGFLLAGLLVTMGTLGDRIGRRRLLLIGAAAFGLASAASAYSHSAGMLIATRALLGVAGATLMPSTLALIRNIFHDQRQRRTAIAVWTAGTSGGAALGPIVGGVLLNHFWWGSVFLINLPVMALLLVVGPLLLPESRDPNPGRFDLVSAGLSVVSVLAVVYGIKLLAQDGVAAVPVLSIAVGAALGVVFWRRQRVLAHPLLDVGLFRNRAFGGSLLVNVVAIFAITGSGLFTTQYLQLVKGLSPLAAAVWSLPAPLAVGLAAGLAAAAGRTVRPAYVVAAGLLLSAVGAAVSTRAQADSSLAVLLTGAILLAAGVGAAMTATADLIVSAAPPERAGGAAALSETGGELGGALGVALMGSIGAAVYRGHLGDRLPAAVPPEAAAAARETLGAAAQVAHRLPGRAGSALFDAANTAFVDALHAVSVAAGVIVVAAAILAGYLLRDVPASTPAQAPDKDRDLVPAA
jgi:DHA2 family multidrug resistance protein-like MFS transporter